MMDIKVDLPQCFMNFLIKNEIISNKELAVELHIPIKVHLSTLTWWYLGCRCSRYAIDK